MFFWLSNSKVIVEENSLNCSSLNFLKSFIILVHLPIHTKSGEPKTQSLLFSIEILYFPQVQWQETFLNRLQFLECVTLHLLNTWFWFRSICHGRSTTLFNLTVVTEKFIYAVPFLWFDLHIAIRIAKFLQNFQTLQVIIRFLWFKIAW